MTYVAHILVYWCSEMEKTFKSIEKGFFLFENPEEVILGIIFNLQSLKNCPKHESWNFYVKAESWAASLSNLVIWLESELEFNKCSN